MKSIALCGDVRFISKDEEVSLRSWKEGQNYKEGNAERETFEAPKFGVSAGN